MTRGYLWQSLSEEVAAEFAQEHPLVRLSDTIPYQEDGWHIEGELGDMSGVRKSNVHRRGEPSTPAVQAFRARRKEAGLCIECGLPRDPESKNYCSRHREIGRLKAEAKRRLRGMKERLPDVRSGITHHFTILTNRDGDIVEVDGYIQTGTYADGRLGEIFVRVGKAGSTEALLDEWAKCFSIALQFGAPLEALCSKFRGSRFEPAGATSNKEIPRCSSIVDYIAQYLMLRYGKKES